MAEECANPLLLQWLKEWMDLAKERNSKGHTVYKKAYQSMKACPITFSHPSEAIQLNGLGPKLCERLTTELKNYCEENGLPVPKKNRKRTSAVESRHTTEQNDGQSPPSKRRKKAEYVPKKGSGGYAIIMALSTLDQEGKRALSKADLIPLAQPYSDTSFTTPSDPTKFFTAWNNMKTLETRELVCSKGHPTRRYYLSDEGWDVALRMKRAEGLIVELSPEKPRRKRKISDVADLEDEEDVIDLGSSREASPQPRTYRDESGFAEESRPSKAQITSLAETVNRHIIILPPESYEVEMLVDTREVRTAKDRDYISQELKKYDTPHSNRALPLGDITWIARVKEPYLNQLRALNTGDEEEFNNEIILEYIVERKRLDDLVFSIKDNRFKEQKFRLHKSGIKHITYLVEEYSISTERSEMYGEKVESAIAGMQVVDNFFVKQTAKIDDTIRYLSRMTSTIRGIYAKQDLHIIPSRLLSTNTYLPLLQTLRTASPSATYTTTFSAFSSLCQKSDNLTLSDVYIKMLMCIRGVTGDKAIEIQKIWKTPIALIEAYEQCKSEKERFELISSKLGDVIPRKKVAKTLSRKIAEVWAV